MRLGCDGLRNASLSSKAKTEEGFGSPSLETYEPLSAENDWSGNARL